MTFPPSRTFALSALALLVLGLVLLVLAGATIVQVFRGAPELGELLTTIQVLAGCLAAVAGSGAGSMALRDFGSKGLTSSQAHLAAAGTATDGLDGP
jgi:hypothetical protein